MPYRKRKSKRHDLHFKRGECVYLIAAGDAIKIGFSANISSRIEHIQTACADKIEVVKVWFDGRSRQIERLAHSVLKPYRTNGRGEWFKFGRAFAILVIDELFAQFPRNPANRPEPKTLLVCKNCGHAGIISYFATARFRCSGCNESRAIRYHAFPCQVEPISENIITTTT